MKDYNSEEIEDLYLINIVCSGLSILGSLFIFFMFVIHKKMKKLPFRLIFYLTIADFGSAVAFCLPPEENFCQIQGGLISYFMLSSIFWCGIISHAMVKVIKFSLDLEKYEKTYLIIGFLLPALSLLILIDTHSYSMSYGWCWINSHNLERPHFYLEIFFRLITYFFPLFCVEIYIITQYVLIKRYFEANSGINTFQEDLKKKVIRKMKLYPLVLFCCQIPCVVIRIMVMTEDLPWFIASLGGIGLAINGMANALVYGVTQDVKKKIKKIFTKSVKEELLDEIDCSTN